MYSEPRACRVEELPALLRLANRVFRPQGGDMAREYPLVFNVGNAPHLRVIDRDGDIVSHVGICLRDAVLLGIPLRVASIGAVCTAPECRGAGLASRLMDDARAHALAHGADLMLISGGRGLYHRLGYVDAGRFPRYRVPSRTDSSLVRVAEYDPNDLPAVRALQEREAVRFLRSRDDWERVLAAGMLMNRPARLWVVRLGEAPVAYLAVQQPRQGHDGRPPTARAMEYAGDRWAIAEAAGAVIAQTGATALDLIGPDGDSALAAQASARGWEYEVAGFAGTLAVLAPERFIARIRPWMAARLGDPQLDALRVSSVADGVRFSLGKGRYALESRGAVTALLFGGESEEARAIPALTGKLGELLTGLFPMPLLWYGYNYV